MAIRPQRRQPVHGVKETADGPTIVLVTVCSKSRRPWLACDDVHALLLEVWREADAWMAGRYVIMPDHIHLFAGDVQSGIDLDAWVRYWKSQYSNRKHCQHDRWGTGHWDTRMRSAEQYEEKWRYVKNNPVRHGLVERPEDWPFQGEVNVLEW